MNTETKNALEAKLRLMLKSNDKPSQKSQYNAGTGNIIRRRKGERDKRFSIINDNIPNVQLA